MDNADFGAMTCKEFCQRYRLGMTKLYEEMNSGRLRAVKFGRRTLILNRDAAVWERTLSTISEQKAA